MSPDEAKSGMPVIPPATRDSCSHSTCLTSKSTDPCTRWLVIFGCGSSRFLPRLTLTPHWPEEAEVAKVGEELKTRLALDNVYQEYLAKFEADANKDVGVGAKSRLAGYLIGRDL